MLIDLLTCTMSCRSTQVKIASTELWPQEMFTFSEMLALVESESSFGAYVDKGALKKKLHQQPHKKKGGGGRKRQCPALCKVCLRPSSPAFFPLSATKALRTTVLVLVSQSFGCPTVVQDLSKRVQ